MKKIVLLVLTVLMLSIPMGIISAEEIFEAEGPGINYIPHSLYNPDKESGIELYSVNGWNISEQSKRELYNLIVSNLNKKTKSFSVSSYRIPVVKDAEGRVTGTVDEFADLYYSAVYNNPQSGYLMTGYSFSYNTSGLVTSIIPYYMPDSEYDEDRYRFMADYALSMCISPDMTEVEKLLSIHDYLTDNIKYNTTNGMWCYTPYGALVDGVAVCQGYSLAYKLLCDRAGLNVSYVVDSPHNHIWNVAEIDGKYYHIDVTWDDPNYPGDTDQSVNQTRHSYFLLSDDTNYEIREFTERTWVNYFGDCTDASFENSVYSKLNLPLVWKDGAFWGRGLKYVSDAYGDRLEYSGRLYKVYNGVYSEVKASDFAPFDELEYRFGYIHDDVLAVCGTPKTVRTLFSASYSGDGDFEGVRLAKMQFDSEGRGVIKGVVGDKQLLWGDNMKPAAYPR